MTSGVLRSTGTASLRRKFNAKLRGFNRQSRWTMHNEMRLVGMKRLAITETWWQVRPTGIHVLNVTRRGTHREASRHGYYRTRPAQAREPALHPWR